MSILSSTLLPFLVSGLDPAVLVDRPAATQIQAETALRQVLAEAPDDLVPVELVKIQAPAPQTTPAKPSTPPAASPAPAPPPSAVLSRDAVIARVEQALTSVKTAEGRFSQIDAYGPADGKFYISRPGKVRFDYSNPEPMFIISDGVSVSIEEPKRDAYDAVPLSSTPLSLFLRSDVDLKKDGSIRSVEQEKGSWFVTLEDRSGEAEGQMILQFRESDFELLGWRSIDGAGEETRVSLTEVKTNVKLKPQLFIVKDPTDRAEDRR